ncbi:hypothetical protein NEFER02_1943 [Nematocida sp. LUAm2]|nr:hypothetical protein NEFER02_1943 [Nematocida sp. LUAm2]
MKARRGKEKESSKKTKRKRIGEGGVFSNASLNAYIQEYLKEPGEEAYKILEENKPFPGVELPCINPEALLSQSSPPLLSVLLSSLLPVEDPPSAPKEEERKRRIIQRGEGFSFLNEKLLHLLSSSLFTKGEIETHSSNLLVEIERYQEILRKIEEINQRNKRVILCSRKRELALFYLLGLIDSVDAGIESLYIKRLKQRKKKKEEDLSHSSEIEELLQKRVTLKEMLMEFSFSENGASNSEMFHGNASEGVPQEITINEAVDNALYNEIGVVCPIDELTDTEKEYLQDMLPQYFAFR